MEWREEKKLYDKCETNDSISYLEKVSMKLLLLHTYARFYTLMCLLPIQDSVVGHIQLVRLIDRIRLSILQTANVFCIFFHFLWEMCVFLLIWSGTYIRFGFYWFFVFFFFYFIRKWPSIYYDTIDAKVRAPIFRKETKFKFFWLILVLFLLNSSNDAGTSTSSGSNTTSNNTHSNAKHSRHSSNNTGGRNTHN